MKREQAELIREQAEYRELIFEEIDFLKDHFDLQVQKCVREYDEAVEKARARRDEGIKRESEQFEELKSQLAGELDAYLRQKCEQGRELTERMEMLLQEESRAP